MLMKVSESFVYQVLEDHCVPITVSWNAVVGLLKELKQIPRDCIFMQVKDGFYEFEIDIESRLFYIDLKPDFYFQLACKHTNLLDLYPDAEPVRHFQHPSKDTISLIFRSKFADKVENGKEVPCIQLIGKEESKE